MILTMPPTGPSQPDAPARPVAAGVTVLAPQTLRSLLTAVTRHKRFDLVEIKAGELVCAARGSDSPALYKIGIEAGRLCISLVMADRYLSQSIEQDLVHNGDKLADLLADELIDADVRLPSGCPPLVVDHFRDPQKFFTFRTILPEVLASPERLTSADGLTSADRLTSADGLASADRLASAEKSLVAETMVATAPVFHSSTAAPSLGPDRAMHQLAAILLAYESCFSRLGGMSAGADEE